MKPTIGRIVHYTPTEAEREDDGEEGKLPPPVAAIIARVELIPSNRESVKPVGANEAEYYVFLKVFGVFSDYRVQFVRYAGTYEVGSWTWPPKEER